MGSRTPNRLLLMTDSANLEVSGRNRLVAGGLALIIGPAFWPISRTRHLTDLRGSQLAFGVTISGEFSSATNDCGLFLLGVGKNPTFQGDCTPFTDWQNWNQTFKEGVRDFSLASMDALQNWWFWTWKVSLTSGTRCLMLSLNLVYLLADRQFLYIRYSRNTPVVIPTWTAEWLDTNGPTHELWKVSSTGRLPSPLRRHVFCMADGGDWSRYNRIYRVSVLPMAASDPIGDRRGSIRRTAHVHANWFHLDTPPSSTYGESVGVGG